jgi:two-component sensor histidine kinase
LSKGPHGSWRLAEQAFSRPTGRVDIQCQEEGEEFILLWTERGGLVQGEPASEGFGSQLSRAAVSGQLGGELHRDWRPEGLVLRLSIKTRSIARQLRLRDRRRAAERTFVMGAG